MAKTKYRVILDTNVIISAVCFPASIPHEIYNVVGDSHILLFSDKTFLELEEVLFRDKFRKYITLQETQAILEYVAEIGNFVNVTSSVDDIVDDPQDNEFLALALDGRADFLVTGNVNHFMHSNIAIRYKDVTICNPADFMSYLDSNIST